MNLARATPSRPRARALALRAAATSAHEALEVSDVDRASFDHFCQRVHDTELVATTAERVAEEHPKRREHEAASRVARARAETISGTSVVVSEDRATVTRMAHCERCHRMAELLGDPTRLWGRGWGSRRETDKPGWPRTWFCPDCWKVEAPTIRSAGQHSFVTPARLGKVIAVSRMRAHAKRRLRLQAQIRQLLVLDPDLGEAVLRTVVYAAESKLAARQWRRLLLEASTAGRTHGCCADSASAEQGPVSGPRSGSVPQHGPSAGPRSRWLGPLAGPSPAKPDEQGPLAGPSPAKPDEQGPLAGPSPAKPDEQGPLAGPSKALSLAFTHDVALRPEERVDLPLLGCGSAQPRGGGRAEKNEEPS
jgi:hypothetical protein